MLHSNEVKRRISRLQQIKCSINDEIRLMTSQYYYVSDYDYWNGEARSSYENKVDEIMHSHKSKILKELEELIVSMSRYYSYLKEKEEEARRRLEERMKSDYVM